MANWGDPKYDCEYGGSRCGQKRISSVLWGIPWGESWENACWSTPWPEQGLGTPQNCVNTGLNIWGEWWVPDSGCIPCWEEEYVIDTCASLECIAWDEYGYCIATSCVPAYGTRRVCGC